MKFQANRASKIQLTESEPEAIVYYLLNPQNILPSADSIVQQYSQFKVYEEFLPQYTQRDKASVQRRYFLHKVLNVYFKTRQMPSIEASDCFKYQQWGKPYLVRGNGSTYGYFNTSFCKNALVAAFSPRNEVGIDIEYLNRSKDPRIMEANMEHFFCESERQYVYQNNEISIQRYLEIWTRKEATLKSIGRSIGSQALFTETSEESEPWLSLAHGGPVRGMTTRLPEASRNCFSIAFQTEAKINVDTITIVDSNNLF